MELLDISNVRINLSYDQFKYDFMSLFIIFKLYIILIKKIAHSNCCQRCSDLIRKVPENVLYKFLSYHMT